MLTTSVEPEEQVIRDLRDSGRLILLESSLQVWHGSFAGQTF